MTVRVERRSITRGNPESRLIDAEDHAEHLAGKAAERCPIRTALIQAFDAYKARYGCREASAWAAARAHFNPGAEKAPARREAAEALFKTGRAA